MKVHKVAPRPKNEQRNATKRHPRNKWQVHNKRIHCADTSRDSLSPATAKLEHQLANRQKLKLKRLQKVYNKTVSLPSEDSPSIQTKGKTATASPVPFPPVHTNGEAEVETGSDSEDSEEWSSYAKSVLQNGTEKGADQENTTGPLLEQLVDEEAPEYHAQYDHVHNHTLVVLKQGQVKKKKKDSCIFEKL